ncbi:MAG: transporter suffix protein [Bacteroidetes bacterium]|nr:transporter suffix protein [Bacteroidota bacterium]
MKTIKIFLTKFSVKTGIILIIVSCVFYSLIFIVPFLGFTIKTKTIVTPIAFGLSSITWYGGLAIVGKDLWIKYKHYINPINWFK